MKKRVLFCIENFQHGGINKALENILALIDRSRYDVGLFVANREDGPYKNLFEPYCHYPADGFLSACCSNYRKSTGLRKIALVGLKTIRKALAKFGYDPFNARLSKWAKRISSDNYACVIAYAEGYVTDFVSKIEGNKAAWIHIDYKRYLEYAGQPDEHNTYKAFNHIVIPSKYSVRSFVEQMPDLKNYVVALPNLIDTRSVIDKVSGSSEDAVFKHDKFSLVSVGRICYEKGFTEIPTIASQLREMGMVFRWYIIGDGSELEMGHLRTAIKAKDVEDFVIMLGRKDNPYPYIAASDLLVSTSLSETFSYVIFEAKTLGVPVVCRDFGTAPEVVGSSEGVITTIDNMAETIFNLYSNRENLNRLKDKLKTYSYNNDKLLDEIYALIENR